MTNIAYWTPTDEPLKDRTLVYILKFPSRDAATKSWKAFQDDPEWIRVKTEKRSQRSNRRKGRLNLPANDRLLPKTFLITRVRRKNAGGRLPASPAAQTLFLL